MRNWGSIVLEKRTCFTNTTPQQIVGTGSRHLLSTLEFDLLSTTALASNRIVSNVHRDYLIGLRSDIIHCSEITEVLTDRSNQCRIDFNLLLTR